MQKNIIRLLIGLFLCAAFVGIYICTRPSELDNEVNAVLKNHYAAYHDKEYFSGIALSVYVPQQSIKNYYIGRVGHDQDSPKIDDSTLFQIGSITKSFTAAIMLQLEKEKKLQLTDSFHHWLTGYEKWPALTIQSLLNMTSGLPNYTDAPLLNTMVFNHPDRVFSNKELIQFVYPTSTVVSPLRAGYFYTNTGYILAAMIIEDITKHSFQAEMNSRLIKPAHLQDTFYPLPTIGEDVQKRLAHGYGNNPYINPELVGVDTKSHSLSWAGAAGALLSNTADIIKWVEALFVANTILDAPQKQQLMQLVSTTSGKSIDKTNVVDSLGFGLGVSQRFDKEIGEFWFYEGETEGFRALYMYVPSSGMIIASIFNSAVNAENDHAGELMKKVYQTVNKRFN